MTTYGTLKYPNICMERRSWWHFKLANPSHPGYNHILHPKDDFTDESEHGVHYFFVTQVLGIDTFMLQNSCPKGILPTLMAKKILKQTLLGLIYLHDLRMCHHGGGFSISLHFSPMWARWLVHVAGVFIMFTRCFPDIDPVFVIEPRAV
ncbi:hypothetical protein BDV93DRAFT_509849 [Ceratobasidium sp. AG-I]|nr:hypothetical protein BDV93DRAFT_509849 [Ceratobasidium sp. AG-I]